MNEPLDLARGLDLVRDVFDRLGLPMPKLIEHCIAPHLLTCLDTGVVTREILGITESCERCRCHEVTWAPYYAEQLRLWMQKHPVKT